MPVSVRLAESADERSIRELDGVALGGDAERIACIHDAVTTGRCLVAENDDVMGYAVMGPRHFFGRDFLERSDLRLRATDPIDRPSATW